MRPFRSLAAVAAAAVVSVGLALPPTTSATAAPARPPADQPADRLGTGRTAASPTGLNARSIAQIDALAQAKRARTAAQRKVDSRLLAERSILQKVQVAAGVTRVRTGVTTDRAGRTQVTLYGAVTPKLLAQVRAVGGTVLGSYPRERSVAANVPLAAISTLAASPLVDRVAAADQAVTARMVPPVPGATANSAAAPASVPTVPTVAPLTKQERAALRDRIVKALASARPTDIPTTASMGSASTGSAATDGASTGSAGTKNAGRQGGRASAPVFDTGSATSEGDVTLGVARARAQYHVSGIGVKIGVLSDGTDSLSAAVASGDLPPDVQVLAGQGGSGDEGTALLEVLHDLAPRTKLEFATAFGGVASFADNIRALRAAGCDIIVDDVLYFSEPTFQDGPIARAVADVIKAGAMYFSSVGNEGSVDAGTSGNWEGDFTSSGRSVGKFGGVANDFDPGPGVQLVDPVSVGTAGAPVILQWADPLGAANDDYDLYALDPDGNVVAFSNNVQNGNDDPAEALQLPSTPMQYRLAVVRYSGAPRYFQLTPFRGRFATAGALHGYATPGVTRGHSTVPEVVSVAAVPAHGPLPFSMAPGDPANPVGPYPGLYTSAQKTERFSADGPRRVFFYSNGAPITPGNFSSTGGLVRQKPDLTAADGVQTSLPGFTPFFGTSAATPHAAAIAALVLSGNPGMPAAQVRAALTSTALDIGAPGWARDSGAGIVMAERALWSTGATPQPFVIAGEPEVVASTDGDHYLEPGESATVRVPVTNIGDGDAQAVSVRLVSETPGVTVTPSIRWYGRIAVGSGATGGGTFTVRAPATVRLGNAVRFAVRVSFVGSHSPRVGIRRIIVGQPSREVRTVAYHGPPVAVPDANLAGASVRLRVTGVGPISRATFSIDGTHCTTAIHATTVGIDHTFDADLIGTLIAPGGTSVRLFTTVGGSGDNICQAVFDDRATRSIQTATTEDAPLTGTWRPAAPLSALTGLDGDGTWTFHLVDASPEDLGSIRAVSIHLSGYVTPPRRAAGRRPAPAGGSPVAAGPRPLAGPPLGWRAAM